MSDRMFYRHKVTQDKFYVEIYLEAGHCFGVKKIIKLDDEGKLEFSSSRNELDDIPAWRQDSCHPLTVDKFLNLEAFLLQLLWKWKRERDETERNRIREKLEKIRKEEKASHVTIYYELVSTLEALS